MGNRQTEKVDIKGCRKIFGRIFLDTDITHSPFLLLRDGTVKQPIHEVINSIVIHENKNDEDIVSELSILGLRPDDVGDVRAYIHRFGTDILHPKTIGDHPDHVLLLDQNAPPSSILDLSRHFGWTTHVGGEGLVGRNFPDEEIWTFAHENNFQAIVTRDTDFIGIQKNRAVEEVESGAESVPQLIFIRENLTADILMAMFQKHAKGISVAIQNRTNLAYELGSQSGMVPLF